MHCPQPVVVCWFRRDLRIDDNVALYHALNSGLHVLPVFIFDTTILSQFNEGANAQVTFILQRLQALRAELRMQGGDILVGHSSPASFFEHLLQAYTIKAIYCNEDYELQSTTRDDVVAQMMSLRGIPFHSFKDHVVFGKNDIVKPDGKPYTVFTPYSTRWKQQLTPAQVQDHNCTALLHKLHRFEGTPFPSIGELGFAASDIKCPPNSISNDHIEGYGHSRDFPALDATSKLGVHLRFGTISIRKLVAQALSLLPQGSAFLNELIWRDFYHSIVWHYPHVCQGKSFKPQYDTLAWRNNQQEFEAWCKGQTGYPMVDAGMRQLNQTGFMHNRLRMITASFLSKHLLVDWRWGESYFANNLLDFDFAANNGGWQWAASCGCDAVPYFRVFNPQLQAQRFDPHLEYIKQWVPEFETPSYPAPIVDHKFARRRVLETFRKMNCLDGVRNEE